MPNATALPANEILFKASRAGLPLSGHGHLDSSCAMRPKLFAGVSGAVLGVGKKFQIVERVIRLIAVLMVDVISIWDWAVCGFPYVDVQPFPCFVVSLAP